jgi:hypothetical protein
MRTSLTRATFVLLLAVVAIAWSHGPSDAITYTYTGVCTTECAEVGLTGGGAVSGTISFLDAVLVPGSPYPAPSSFSLQFGSVVITEATADSFGLFAFPLPPFPVLPTPAIVPADLTSFVAELHVGEDPIAPATAADGLIIAPSGQWIGTADGNCNDAECHFLFTRGDPAQGSGAWSVAAVAVPMPATLSVLVIAMLGTAWLTRANLTKSKRGAHGPSGASLHGTVGIRGGGRSRRWNTSTSGASKPCIFAISSTSSGRWHRSR